MKLGKLDTVNLKPQCRICKEIHTKMKLNPFLQPQKGFSPQNTNDK